VTTAKAPRPYVILSLSDKGHAQHFDKGHCFCFFDEDGATTEESFGGGGEGAGNNKGAGFEAGQSSEPPAIFTNLATGSLAAGTIAKAGFATFTTAASSTFESATS
jgi:hypothetical protein